MRKYFMICILLMFFTGTVFATIYYVNDNDSTGDIYCSQQGNDGNSGLATNLPKRNIKKIFESYAVGPGDIVYVDTGSYTGGDNEIKLTPTENGGNDNGSANNYLTIRGAGIMKTHVDAGGGNWWCFWLQQRQWIKIADMYMNASSSGHENILLEQCTNCMITNCKTYQALGNGHGIKICQSAIDNKIIGCKVGGTPINQAHGIYIQTNCNNNLIFKNEIWSNQYSGVTIENACSSNTILSNDIHHNRDEGIKVYKGGGGASEYNRIVGNKIYNNNDSNGADKGGIRIIENSDHSEIRDNQVYLNEREWNISIRNARYCIVSNNMAYNCVDTGGGERVGMGFWNVTNTLICDNEIYGNPYDGIKMTDDSISNRIEYNIFRNNSQHGILINVNSTDNRLFRNLSYYNTSEGIRIDNNSDRAIVLNNTSFRNGKGILFDNNVDSCILRNNISLSNNNEGIQVVVAGGVTNSYNNSYGNGGGNNYVGTFRDGPGRISSNARFLSTHTNSSSFLRLSPTNSPCINTGSPDDPVPQKGGSRVDMGAIEVTNQPPQVILLTPANDSISGTNIVHFNWEPATGGTLGITNYKIEIASDINFINVAFSNTTAATSCQATLNDGKYYWHVRANDRAGNAGPWSLSRTITVGAEKTGALQEGEAKAYPVPCPRNRNLILEYGYNSGKVLEKVDLTVWDIFGNKVIDKNVLLESASPGKTEWDLKNSRNDKTMPGVYLYMIEIKYVDGSKVDSGYKKLIITK